MAYVHTFYNTETLLWSVFMPYHLPTRQHHGQCFIVYPLSKLCKQEPHLWYAKLYFRLASLRFVWQLILLLRGEINVHRDFFSIIRKLNTLWGLRIDFWSHSEFLVGGGVCVAKLYKNMWTYFSYIHFVDNISGVYFKRFPGQGINSVK